MLYDDIRKHITAQIKTATGMEVFYNRADETEEKPYISFDLSELDMQDDFRHNYTMQVDFWDMDSPKAILEAKGKLDKHLKRYLANEADFVLLTHPGSLGEMVEDEDKRIRHYARTYDLMAYSKKGE